MTIRGAPAIGAAAAFGLALAAQESRAATVQELMADLERASAELKQARPTAVNLAWALDRMMGELTIESKKTGPVGLRGVMLREAQRLADEDVEINKRMGSMEQH